MESHPHLLKHFSGEECVGERLLIVMELADGSLLDRWRQYRNSGAVFPLIELVTYLQEAAEGLDYIHGNDLIHGGINPGDILLLNGHVKIADPGNLNCNSPDDRHRPFGNLSKVACLAPEIGRGVESPQSDQYALAATYAWLRLGYPLEGPATRVEELSRGGLSEAERAPVLKALSSEPDDRYPTCVEFAAAVRRAILDNP
jgi:serine/threonine protein kinase